MRKALGSWKLTDLERRLCNILDVARRAVEQLARRLCRPQRAI